MIPMKNVKILAGAENPAARSFKCFSEEACSFLAELSNALMKNRAALAYPDIISFAFFCRKSNLAAIKQRYEGELRVGRGLALHIAPSNVPINFAFSFVFGVLAGNSNVVRVSTKQFPQVDIVCAEISRVLESYPFLKECNSIVSYPSDCGASEELSAAADVRIIWGGNNTVNTFKKMQVKPRCVDIAFSDRYSIGVIDGAAIKSAEEKELNALAEAFYNDTYLMDQNACSSPRMMFWLNSDEEAKSIFWSHVKDYAEKKYKLQAESAVDKFLQLCRDVIDNDDIRIHRDGNILSCVDIQPLPEDITALRGSCGYFYQHDISALSDISSYINDSYQTVCCYGIPQQQLTDWVYGSGLMGIDRVVPFGKSLDINEIWDGYDIIRFASRIVVVR